MTTQFCCHCERSEAIAASVADKAGDAEQKGRAMKLFYVAGSPYARIIRVVLRETGLIERLPEGEVTLRDPNSALLKYRRGWRPVLPRRGISTTSTAALRMATGRVAQRESTTLTS
jgi:hypothetical protein